MTIDEVGARRKKKRGWLAGVLRAKCPHCRQGNLFVNANPYSWKGMLAMPDTCPVCGQDFQIEPGFYSGAPFMSYPLVLVIGVPLFLVLTLVLDVTLAPAVGFTMGVLLGIQPVLMRFGRALWLYMFVPPR